MIYLDASALVKLVVRESETDALRSHLARMDLTVASSSIASIGLNRAVLRVGGEALLVERAGQVIEQVDLVPVDQGIVESASSLEPAALRSPAASLASALRIGEGLAEIVCYDERLNEAARTTGLAVSSPAA